MTKWINILRFGNILNDEIINTYIAHNIPENCFLIDSLVMSTTGRRNKIIENLKEILHSIEIIICVMNIQNHHWIVGNINIKKKEIEIWDSL